MRGEYSSRICRIWLSLQSGHQPHENRNFHRGGLIYRQKNNLFDDKLEDFIL